VCYAAALHTPLKLGVNPPKGHSMHILTILGIILIALGTVLTYWGQDINNKKSTSELQTTITSKNGEIDELVQGKNQLLSQNEELLGKVSEYQKDLKKKEEIIEQLEVEAKKAARGIVSMYDFNGAKRESVGGSTTLMVGEEHAVFQNMVKLKKSGKLEQLSNLCEQQIKKTPEWLTPYFYLGLASADMGDKEKTITYLEHVISNAPGDPDYAQAIEILKRIKSQ
jgi:tetratricopeptide (TPR) repeat protein